MFLPKRSKDITGQKFHLLTAVSYSRSDNGAFWLFSCDCGKLKEMRASFVAGGHVKSCGCLSEKTRFVGTDWPNAAAVNGILKVRPIGKTGHNFNWEFLCPCGAKFIATLSNVLRGNTRSCGCLKSKINSEKATTHGMSTTRSYMQWQSMISRCSKPSDPAYKSYGERGITVCERWLSFENFFADMGSRPNGKTLDRRDNDKGYSPDNCRWATQKEQANNTRANILLTYDGQTKTLTQWAEIHGVPVKRVFARRYLGWPDAVLFAPKNARLSQRVMA